MNTKIKFLLYLLLFALGFLGVQDFCRKQTRGFTLAKARSSCQSQENLELSKKELQSIQTILDQPFSFLTRGLQCYVFVSQDEKYVLKLLKWKELELPFWAKCLPTAWTSAMRAQKQRKKEHDFTSYQIAFNELKEETGLVYLHLHKTKGLNADLCLYDPLKIQHRIPADQIEFILQKKADPFLPFFESNKDHEIQLQSFLSNFVEILRKRMEKKISDSDISLEYNMGIYEGTPLLFDIGNLTQVDSICLKNESRLVMEWLKSNSPHLASFLEKELEYKASDTILLKENQ